MPLLLSLVLLATPADKPPLPRTTRIAHIAVTAPIMGGLIGAAGFGAALWATRPSTPTPWVTRVTVAVGYAAGVALGTWVAGLRAGSGSSGWWALLGSVVGAGLSLAVWAGIGGREGDAAGASMLVMLPVFSSAALYEAFALP